MGEVVHQVVIHRDFGGLRLGDLIAVKSLEMRISAGTPADLDRPVTWAHATEMVDPRPHLRGGELVCTVGSAMLSAQDCLRLVEAVHATNATGICIGLGEVHTKSPRALLRECKRLSVPLIEMSHGVPFLAINDVLVQARMTEETATSVRDGELMGQLLEGVRSGSSTDQLLGLASEVLGGQFSYLDSGVPTTKLDNASVADTPSEVVSSIVVELGEKESLSWQGLADTVDAVLIAQIARIVQIATRAGKAKDSEHRYRLGQLFSLIADGLAHPAALVPELQSVGLIDSAFTVSTWPVGTAGLLATHAPDVLIADTPTMVFAITPDAAFVHEAADALGLVCGYSNRVEAPNIARGISEARATLALARTRGIVSGPHDLTTLTALLEQQPSSRLAPFVDQLVMPLFHSDVRGGNELLSTLRSFLLSGSVQDTAEKGFLHVNTVRHRLKRISQLTGRDPLRHQDRVDLSIAIWSYDRAQRTQD